jgi:hypothetical protein
MNRLLTDLDDIFQRVQNLKLDNEALREKIDILENINRQLKVEVDTLNHKIHTDKNEAGSSPDNAIDRDADMKDETDQESIRNRSVYLSEKNVAERLSVIESEIDECLQMLENRS